MRRMQPVNKFEQFENSLYSENLRGYHELEAMKHGLAARLGLCERDALELAVRIVIAADTTNARMSSAKMSRG